MSDDEKMRIIENLLEESDVYISFLDDLLGSEEFDKKDKDNFLETKSKLEKSRDELRSFLSVSGNNKSR